VVQPLNLNLFHRPLSVAVAADDDVRSGTGCPRAQVLTILMRRAQRRQPAAGACVKQGFLQTCRLAVADDADCADVAPDIRERSSGTDMSG
jgi:hypothetical protein